MTEEKENCNFQQNYNVFGLDDKPCCYLYHKYCDEIDNCYFKKCKRLEQENKELKETVKDLNQSIQNCNIQRTKMYKALEEIKEMIIYCEEEYNCDRCKYHDNCCIDDDKFPDFSKALINKIDGVLQ